MLASIAFTAYMMAYNQWGKQSWFKWLGLGGPILNAILPSLTAPGQTRLLDPAKLTTQEQGGAIPLSYGTQRIAANVVAHYSDCTLESDYTPVKTLTRSILACFGEGPIAAIDTDSVRINGRPITDFPGLSCSATQGTVGQAALTGWAAHSQDYGIGQTCLYNSAVTYEMGSTGWDALAVLLRWPNGFIKFHDDGDSAKNSVTVKVELGDAIADTWHTLAECTLTGRTRNTCFYKFLHTGTYTGGSAFTLTSGMLPRVRVTRTQADSTATRISNEFELMCLRATRNIGFTHPGMIMMSLTDIPDELLEDGISELTVATTGRIVDDGASTFAASRYHADAVRDILTQPVIEGAGTVPSPWSASYYRGVDTSRLVASGFTSQKTLADSLAADGKGGTEALACCDIVMDESTNCYDAIASVCASGRCGLYMMGQYFGLWLDTARTPVGLLCDGTVSMDDPPSPRPIPHENLASEMNVAYRDGSVSYRDRQILIQNTDIDTLVSATVQLPAVTRTSEAGRTGRRELARNNLCDQELSCVCGIDAVVYERGDVLVAQVDGKSLGGRLAAVSGRVATLDRDVSEVVTGTDALCVQVRDGTTGVQSIEWHGVASISGRDITIDEDFTGVPAAGDPYLFGPTSIETDDEDQFEVVSTQMDEALHVGLDLIKYVPALDDLDDVDPTVPLAVGVSTNGDRYAGTAKKPITGDTIDMVVGYDDALVGDGVADDTDALKGLIADALESGQELVLPSGTFLITDTLDIGDGTAEVNGFRIRGKAGFSSTLKWGGAVDTKMVNLVSCCNFTVENLCVDGDDVSGVTGIYQGTGASGTSQIGTVRNCAITGCDIAYHIKQTTSTCDYLRFEHVSCEYGRIGLKVEGGARQVAVYDGRIVSNSQYGIEIVDGSALCFNSFFGGNAPPYTTGTATFTASSATVTGSGTAWTSAMAGRRIWLDADEVWHTIQSVESGTSLTLTDTYSSTGGSGAYKILDDTACDIYLSGPISNVEVYASKSESLKIFDGDWGSAGYSRLLSPNIFDGVNQSSHDMYGGELAIDTSINYDSVRPLIVKGCKFMGDIALGTSSGAVVSIATDFYNYYRSIGADPVQGFTGNTAAVNYIAWPDMSTGTGGVTSAVNFGGGRLIVGEDGWMKGIDVLDESGTIYRRIGFSSAAPDTYYAKVGWIVFNVGPANDEPVGWVCTVAGNGATETVKATWAQFGQNLLGATVTDFARNTILECEDAADLIIAAGLGTLAAQDADDVTITGGSVSGITDLAVADGGTGASTAADARSNLGVLSTGISDTTTAKTADYTVLSGDSGKWFTNAGSSGTVILTLPTATIGLKYRVTRTDSQVFNLKPASGEKFATRAADAYFCLGGDDCTLDVMCIVTGVWHIFNQWGAYTWA